MAQVPSTSDPAQAARGRFRATGSAYLHFALAEQGLFAVAFLPEAHPPQIDAPPREARGREARGRERLGPSNCSRTASTTPSIPTLAPELRAYSDVAAWSAVISVASLLL